MLEPPPLDASRPNIARVYDYELGGNDNYAADRAEAERLVAIYPHLPKLVGTTGCSWPERWPGWPGEASGSFSTSTAGCPPRRTHQIARAAQPDCHAYVDSDPAVVSHARALLSDTDVTAIRRDLANPDVILADPCLRNLVNHSEPTAIVLWNAQLRFDICTCCY
jgi:hypothetical protein